MKILELFSGTESFSKVARDRGHEVFTIDINDDFKPNLCKDIMEVTSQEILEKFGQPDVIWASPPCTTFSIASVYRYWDKGKPKNEKTLKGIEIVKKTLQIIKELNPKIYFIENPRGMLRKQDFMNELKRDTITYCQYGLPYQKATDIWNNSTSWKPKPMCSPKAPCHVRSPRGSSNGVQGTNGYRENRNQQHPVDISRLSKRRDGLHPDFSYIVKSDATIRGIIPKELCEEIIKSCEEHGQNI